MGGGGSGSSEEEYFNVDMVTTRIMEDNQLYDAFVREGVARTKYPKYGSIEFLHGLNSSGFYPLTNYYNFSTWYNKEAFPKVVLQGINVDNTAILNIIADKENVLPEEVKNFSVFFTAPTLDTWVKYRLQEEYGYIISDSNHVTVDGVDYIIEEFREVVINTILKIEVILSFLDPPSDPELVPPVLQVPMTPMGYAYVASYTVDINKFWIYYPLLGNSPDIGQTNIPGLNLPLTGATTFETYPVTLLRHNYFSLDEYELSVKVLPAGDGSLTAYRPNSVTLQAYKDTDYTVNSLGLTLDLLLKSINENPSINEISDVFLFCGMDPTDNHPVTSKMLYETFIHIDEKSKIFSQKCDDIPPIPRPEDYDELSKYEIAYDEWKKISDKISECRSSTNKAVTITRDPFNLGLTWNSAHINTIDDVIGEVGEYTHYIDTYTFSYEVNECVWDSGEVCTVVLKTETVPRLVIKNQITPTEVNEIQVINLIGATVIGRSYTGSLSATATSSKLIIPVPTAVMELFTPIEKIEVMERTLRFVFYAAKLHIEKLKWYESGFFGFILQVISIIIIVLVNLIPGVGQGLSAALAAAYKAFVIGIAIQLAMRMITSFVDVPFMEQIAGVVMIVAGIATGYIDISSVTTVVTTAVQVIDIAMSAITGIINLDTLEIAQDMEKQRQRFQSASEELSEIEKELGMGLTTEDIVNMGISAREYLIPPSDYYDFQFNLLYNYDLPFNSNYDSVNKFYDDKFNVNK